MYKSFESVLAHTLLGSFCWFSFSFRILPCYDQQKTETYLYIKTLIRFHLTSYVFFSLMSIIQKVIKFESTILFRLLQIENQDDTKSTFIDMFLNVLSSISSFYIIYGSLFYFFFFFIIYIFL